ncbi:MAG: 6-phosphogluconolactonase [Deltaproteobacteria bacterium GWB2_55_19]|nr:MAG: 6-phosphogluconolactonase [Deltaproteobacteria bacterium GWB2_55_19]HAO93931.1 6-phosphogluconolactonase [Deltaproteobacteria bacterium]
MEITERPDECICVLGGPEEMSRRAAETFLEAAERNIRGKGRFTVALSGGKTPEMFYELLGAEYADKIEWSKVHVFWGDERCVPPESPESNYNMAARALLSKIKIPDKNIHRIKGEDEPTSAAIAYEEELRAHFGLKAGEPPAFDLVLLGLGKDGHTLSIFPATKTGFEEEERLVIDTYVEKKKARRVTMTLKTVNSASIALFLVSGKEKAGILREVLRGTEEACPARMVRPGKLIWLVDKDAASRL